MSALGPANPLPPVAGMLDPPYRLDFSDAPREIVDGAGYGQVTTVLPYLLQDGYGRDPRPVELETVVLENELLRATFLPGLGGRLWSLVDVAADRELLFQPTTLQPANLALRGAWFAGGVEWNIGTRGHCPHTCDPLHAAVVTRDDGTAALRMWEYERMRGVVFQVEAWLPPGSPVLLVGVAIHNPRPEPVPMYWWSNAAVPQTADTVVRAPATSAFRTGYSGRLERVPAQDLQPGRSPAAADYFYEIDPGIEEPWIEAGLVQRSTARLRGRKLFCWGETIGGHHWQEWLGGRHYCEIQAGLACTQYEHLPLPPGTTWTWVETYGPVAPAGPLDGELAAFERNLPAPVGELLSTGSGWGALEALRRRDAGEPDVAGPGTPFPESTLGPEHTAWLQLLAGGSLPDAEPVSYVTGAGWQKLLDGAPRTWVTAYHLGVIAHAAGDVDAARAHYRASLDLTPTHLAQRALGLLDGDPDLLVGAHRRAPQLWQLAAEALAALCRADRPGEALALVDALAPEVRAHGRIRLGEARAALANGERDRAAALLRTGIEVADLREGEVSLQDLWTKACPGDPLPARYDFRMQPV